MRAEQLTEACAEHGEGPVWPPSWAGFRWWTCSPETGRASTPVPVVYAGRIKVLQVADDQTGRVDSWIWSVRLAKTRSAASSACRAGHVRVNGARVKPAHPIRAGNEVRLRQDGRERIVVVTQVISKRVSAPVAAECYVDHSPPPPPRNGHPRGRPRTRRGGPTKRERRSIDKLLGRKSR